jgi:hypothetical protein
MQEPCMFPLNTMRMEGVEGTIPRAFLARELEEVGLVGSARWKILINWIVDMSRYQALLSVNRC